ncbi:uncharacterized protein K489DRAFT_317480 [Dissoconium aciculare CBS 342.82]|uniref:DNA repair protein Rad26 n=1 Tax=Dissoconium aciculare CBS 342.82 TaxID=1314786 RepID=A0A6J3M645_9PEZI|nr:uncharacterized protein K489DRAFT_317480 [Dissoconium aciculare CBS 342.82]KAF1823358.1 hypothetical protein K489DRAFT_317480 [Dissoconium aciculare CBS 342.82]
MREHQYGSRGRGTTVTDDNADVMELQARIAALEAEKERLRLSERAAHELALAKQGEIQIVRSKLDISNRTYEAKLAAMVKQHHDETTRQKLDLEASKRERELLETDNRFIHHDLVQEAERAKRLNGLGKLRTNAASRGTAVGKSRKAGNGMGDGFDEAEVHSISPSRSRDRSQDQTPKVGGKRKRMAPDSPIPLAFSQARQPVVKEDSVQTVVSLDSVLTPPTATARADEKFVYYQMIMNHRPFEGHCRTFEAFAKMIFPSTPDRSLASLFGDQLGVDASPDIEAFAQAIASIMLDFWTSCLKEKHFAPFYLILNLLKFVLKGQRAAITANLIEQALPLCVKSIDLIAVENARNSLYGMSSKSAINTDARAQLVEELVIDEVVDFLHDLCQAASLFPERLRDFWTHLEVSFLLVLLNPAQPIFQVTTMLRMLGSSALDTTFGAIVNDPDKQRSIENGLVAHLTSLLFDTFTPPADEQPYTIEEITELRLEILKLFMIMCEEDHGGRLLAQHRSAIGRLVRFLDGQVSKLYTVTPGIGLEIDAPQRQAHNLIVETVNITTRLLYHLLRTYDGTIDIVQKLRAVLGGYHKFLGSLSRVAFSTQLVFEEGIDDAAADAAHAILDRVLGPDDGEAVMQAVETPRSGSTSVLRRAHERDGSEIV